MIKGKVKLFLALVIAGTLMCLAVPFRAKKSAQQDEGVQIIVVPGAVDNYTPDSKMKKNRKNSIYKTKQPKDHLSDGRFFELTTEAIYENAIVLPAQKADKGKGKTTDLTLARPLDAAKAGIPHRALILYDAPEDQAFQKIGLIYAIMLENLLGHFKADITLMPIEDYYTGMVESYDTTFYLGAYYNNSVSPSFMNDVMTTQQTIVWFKYNIWQLAWDTTKYDFTGRFGFSFNGLRGLNQEPSAGEPDPGFFDTVLYKGLVFKKYYDYDVSNQTVIADPDVGVTQVIDPAEAEVLVPIENSVTSEQVPYIIRSNNFWYIGDMPFSFIGPRDRYLVICDILHDILQIQHPEDHRAMVRLEDVSPIEDGNNMETLTDYLGKRKIPFSIAVVPVYWDPLGHYNGYVPMKILLSDAAGLLDSLQYATQRGGDILMHGYTHQYDATPNPYTGVTADDFEFWNIVDNSPVAEEDSAEWALERILAGLNEFQAPGIEPFIFETPHYIASPKSYQAMGELFAGRYERSYYYTSEVPQLNTDFDNPDRDFAAGQFFPYIIYSDHYGQIVIPENLGNIEYDIREIDPLSYIDYGWKELKTNAEYALTVRDGYASFFFHPFWLERDLGVSGFRDFKNLVNAITRLGYKWVGAKSEFEQINSN